MKFVISLSETISVVLIGCILVSGCGAPAVPPPPDDHVKTMGTIEVEAELMEIPGEFPPNKLYDYAYVLKYKVIAVHRGTLDSDVIYVGHYNPLKPRDRVTDKRVQGIGGNLRSFKAGERHHMALENSIDDFYMGGIINEYHGEVEGPVYWAVWTNRASN